MSDIVFLDYENHDPYITSLGPGWATGLNTIIGMGYETEISGPQFADTREKRLDAIKDAKILVAHNGSYDFGYLYSEGVDLSKYTLICTRILSRLVYNLESSASLSALSKKYFNDDKSDRVLGLLAIRYRIFKLPKTSTLYKESPAHREALIKKATNTAKQNLHLLYEKRPDVVIQYCNHDVILTKKLYKYLMPRIYKTDWIEKFSDLLRITIKMRARGVPVDIEKLAEISERLNKEYIKHIQTLENLMGGPVNINSNKDLQILYDGLGISYPKTDAGNPSFTAGWLEKQDDEASRHVKAARKAYKIRNDYCDIPLQLQEILPDNKKGRIYPQLNIYGARTGRFSCTNPNMQQIPPEVREAYLPEPGDRIGEADFSAQEIRIQVHFAAQIEAPGIQELIDLYRENPEADAHQKIADMIGNCTRKKAKDTNLGLSYGMGIPKLSKNLMMTESAARTFLKKYHKSVPYLKYLIDKVTNRAYNKNYITTLLGRRLYMEPGFSYKAFNALIQGSAGDEIMEAMIQLDKAGIIMLASVHDAIVFSYNGEDTPNKVKHIMETCINLNIPMHVDVITGNNWSETK